MLTITLAAEILNTIAKTWKKLENQCKSIVWELMLLGQMYSSKIEDEKFYEWLITEVDFKNWSVLKIIAVNKFEYLMDENDPKAENMMMGIW